MKFRSGIILLMFISIWGCSNGSNNSVILAASGKHPAGWVVALTGGNHPDAYLNVPSSCFECHGKDLAGGISNISCFSASRNGIACHPGGPSNHPAGWAAAESHGAAAKAVFSGRNGMPHCQRCHGNDFSGTAQGPSCLNNAACHGAGKLSAHSPSPWLSKIGGRTHHNADASNAGACAVCHINGANSTRQPSPAAPAGTAPGCYNNTLCHGVEGHASGWNAASQHGAAAKDVAGGSKGFSSCTQCHGTQFDGGIAGQSCLSTAGCHGAAVAAPHPPRPWKTAGGVTHTSTDTSNASQCVPCHTNGANSTRAPRPGDPVGTSSCFNNTLCHGTIGHAAGWSAANQHGAEAKKAPTASTGFSSCQSCHGTAFNNGSATSCMKGLGCHGLLVNSPHPAKPWASTVAGAPTHTNTDTGNVGTCAICHTGGANSDVKPPTPAAGTAGCFNNTLCHFHVIPYADPAAHGAEAKKDLTVCKVCHGTSGPNFDGGTAPVACSGCHTFAKAHPTDWQGSGTYSHRTAGNRANACSICHNITTAGAGPLAKAPSCISAEFANADGTGATRTCHASGPGNAPHSVPYTNHNATGATNFTNCQGCHQVAANGTAIPPGCMNCHITSPVVTPNGCTSCHGNPPNSGGYPNVAAAHAAHLPASKVATTALACADCHTGLGLGTVDHQVRAKARTATGRANPVVFSSLALIGATAAFNDTNDQCTNTYCHGAQMPGGDTTGNNRSPIWSSPFLPATISVTACGTCHGFPPSTASGHPSISAPAAFPLGSGCNCHANINSAGTTYTNIFINKALHINGIFEPTAGGHTPLFPNYNHQAAGTGASCTGCHAIGTATSVYPATVLGNAPDCRGCHRKAAPGVGCGSCHGTTNGRPNGTSFPDRQGSSNGHSRGAHSIACTSCHPITTGNVSHGWSNRTKSSNAVVVPALNWNPGSRAANTGTCNPSAGSFTGCHTSRTGWY